MRIVSEPEILVSEEEFEVQWNKRDLEVIGRVTFHLARNPQIRIETSALEWDELAHGLPRLEDKYVLRVKSSGQQIDVLAIGMPTEFGEKLKLSWHFVPQTIPVLIDTRARLQTVVFGIVNFGQFCTQELGEPGLRKDHLQLKGGGWKVLISPRSQGQLGEIAAAESAFHRVTHTAVLTRDGGSEFSAQEAHNALEDLSSFLSFCRGRDIAPAFVKGFDVHGRLSMQEWGTRFVDAYSDRTTWMENLNAQELVNAFPGFMRLISNQEWRDALASAVYWYSRTNGAAAGVDGSLVLAQAAFEGLAWEVVVRDKELISSDGFGRLPAADQLRLMLRQCGIPLDIPSGLKELISAAKGFNWENGAQALVETRNSIVHAGKKRGMKRANMPVYDAWRLAQWYLELVLLKLFDFNGRYCNRTLERRYPGQVESVPWAL